MKPQKSYLTAEGLFDEMNKEKHFRKVKWVEK